MLRSIPLLVSVASVGIAAPITYGLNKDHTDVTFKISHAGFTMKHGSFAAVSGSLNLDAGHLEESSVDVTVAVNSIMTNHEKRDHDLQGPNFLDALQFPTMRCT